MSPLLDYLAASPGSSPYVPSALLGMHGSSLRDHALPEGINVLAMASVVKAFATATIRGYIIDLIALGAEDLRGSISPLDLLKGDLKGSDLLIGASNNGPRGIQAISIRSPDGYPTWPTDLYFR